MPSTHLAPTPSGSLVEPVVEGQCPGCGWTPPAYLPANLITYALHDHRSHACTGTASSVTVAAEVPAWPSWRRRFALLLGVLAMAAATVATVGIAMAPAVLAAGVTVTVLWSGHRAVVWRVGSRRVHRLTIDLGPGYHAELQRQAREATDGSVTDLLRQALALHRYVWEHRDAELLTRAEPSEPIVQLTLCNHRRQGASRPTRARRWPRPLLVAVSAAAAARRPQ